MNEIGPAVYPAVICRVFYPGHDRPESLQGQGWGALVMPGELGYQLNTGEIHKL